VNRRSIITFLGVFFLIAPFVVTAQSPEKVITDQKEKSKCIFGKKNQKPKTLSQGSSDFMLTKELVLLPVSEPLHNLNGVEGNKLKVLLFDYWKSELKTENDSAINQIVDFDKQEVSYLINAVANSNKQELVSITLQVKNQNGVSYATLIFCVTEIKSLLQSNTVEYKGNTLTVWDYLHAHHYTSKDIKAVKIDANQFPCYFVK